MIKKISPFSFTVILVLVTFLSLSGCGRRYIGTTAPSIAPLSTEVEQQGGIYWTPGNYASGATVSASNAAANAAATAVVAVYSASNTATVKTKVANALGLYDMNGNVYQCCFDLIPGSSTWWIFRGADWHRAAYEMNIGSMNCFTPGFPSSYNGFRIVRTQ